MLTNKNRSFQNSYVIDTGLSDFYKVIVTVLRSHLNKLGPKIIYYRGYKNVSNDAFRFELVIENGILQNLHDVDSLSAKCKNVFKRTAPLKQNHVRANGSPFINKTTLKAVMKQQEKKKN